ncbi:MAG: hypothetical protein Fur0032_22780 [Terrimicrobiaceae bacterium]
MTGVFLSKFGGQKNFIEFIDRILRISMVSVNSQFNNPPNMKKTSVILAALAVIALPSAQATLLVYEPFLTGGSNYNTSISLIGQGPTSLGFTGNWITGTTGPADPVATGLTYTGVESAGGAATIGTSNVRTGRLLETPFTASTTGTYYLSFLMDLGGVDSQYKALEVHDGGFAASNRNFRLGNGGGAGGFSATNFGFRIADGASQDLGAADTNVNFFVVRFDLSSTAASDTVTVYRNPSDLSVETNNTGVTLSGQDIHFDRITLAQFTSQQVTYDEIRIGTTFTSVIPEPSSAALLGIAGAAFGLIARRVRNR